LLFLASHLHLHHFFSSTPPLASNIQKVTHHLLEEVEESLDDNTDMAYNPEEEDHELLLNMLHTSGEMSKLI
jgi:hypothetical protein